MIAFGVYFKGRAEKNLFIHGLDVGYERMRSSCKDPGFFRVE